MKCRQCGNAMYMKVARIFKNGKCIADNYECLSCGETWRVEREEVK